MTHNEQDDLIAVIPLGEMHHDFCGGAVTEIEYREHVGDVVITSILNDGSRETTVIPANKEATTILRSYQHEELQNLRVEKARMREALEEADAIMRHVIVDPFEFADDLHDGIKATTQALRYMPNCKR